MGQASLRNVVDGFVREDHPNRNYSESRVLRVQGTSVYSFLYAPNPAPAGATILSATLRLYTHEVSGSTTLSVVRFKGKYAASRVTFDTMPIVTGNYASVTQGPVPDQTVWEFDVTPHIQTVVDGTDWHGWQLSTSSSSEVRLYSANYPGDVRPELVVEWSDAPDAPTEMSPAGGRAISQAAPVVRFDYTDVSGSTTLDAVQVQVDAAGSWVSPDWDSGEVTSPVPELDLGAAGWSGLADGGSAWWRVRVRDAAGVWSDWSAGAQFSRATKGALTLTNPPDLDPDPSYVEDTTPPITWSYTGTQTAWMVIIFEDGQPWQHWLWTSGKVAGTETTVTPPPGVIKRTDRTYWVKVMVWDDALREYTPGDPVYTPIYRAFTYDLTTGVSPASSLTVAPDADQLGAVLTFARGTQPDAWTIVRDGQVVAADLDPADLDSPDTLTWQWTDDTAHPRREHTWEARAVVNGQTSKGNPTAAATLEPVGIWLIDPNTGTRVVLAGEESGEWTMGEQSTRFEPLGAEHPILVTQGMRGYEGSISGLLIDWAAPPSMVGRTAQGERDHLLELKGRAGSKYRLVINDQNIPVVVSNVSVYPLPGQSMRFAAGFDFFQSGELDYTVKR